MTASRSQYHQSVLYGVAMASAQALAYVDVYRLTGRDVRTNVFAVARRGQEQTSSLGRASVHGLIMPGAFAIAIAYIGEEWPPESVARVMSVYVSGTSPGRIPSADRLGAGARAVELALGFRDSRADHVG